MTEKETKGGGGKKRKQVFAYGNYKYYYGYRIGSDAKEDPRMLALKKEWFEGKDCLDVGCNQGVITVNIAKKFHCRSILGVDIDGGLINTAYWYLRKVMKKEASSSKPVQNVPSDVSSEGKEQMQERDSASSEKKANSFLDGGDLLSRVSFRKENFVESLDGCSETYDTILCLSVSKWIHLNWGDTGLITLFVKVWRLLRQGGIFLFEPQPWISYVKNRRVSETTKENFSNILFKPDIFEEILLDKVGFRSVENVTANLPGTVAGFERPIFAFRK